MIASRSAQALDFVFVAKLNCDTFRHRQCFVSVNDQRMIFAFRPEIKRCGAAEAAPQLLVSRPKRKAQLFSIRRSEKLGVSDGVIAGWLAGWLAGQMTDQH